MLATMPLLLSALFLSALASGGEAPLADDSVDLSSRSEVGRARAVSVHLKVGGHLQTSPPPTDRLAPPPPLDTPVAVDADLQYTEVFLRENASARFYDQVKATVQVGSATTLPTLREDRRLVVVQVNRQGKRLRAVEGLLHRQEFETLDLLADSLAIDALLPDQPVAPGSSWEHDAATMLGFVGLESIDVCEVRSLLVETNEQFARCRMTGVVHGRAHGATLELEIDANYLVDHQRGGVTQMSLAVRENRESGPARPGFKGVVNLEYKATPVEGSASFTEAMLKKASRHPLLKTPLVETENFALGFAATHDLAWYATGSHGHSMTLRRVEDEGLVAHGNLLRLPAKRLDPKQALADFRADTARMIGDAMTHLISEEQWTNTHGCRVMAIVAEGEVAGVPIEWHTFLVAPPEGAAVTHRLALTFTVEKSESGRLARHDRQFVDRIELIRTSADRKTAGRSLSGEKLVH